MNTASQNLEHHLTLLQQKLQHQTDYEQAIYYFLEEFAGDPAFIKDCEREDSPHLVSVLRHVAGKSMGGPAELEAINVFRLEKHRFTHGNAAVAGRVILFLYFDGLNTGVMAIIPGFQGPTDVARFRLPSPLGENPNRN
jgi:hypothetical protein